MLEGYGVLGRGGQKGKIGTTIIAKSIKYIKKRNSKYFRRAG